MTNRVTELLTIEFPDEYFGAVLRNDGPCFYFKQIVPEQALALIASAGVPARAAGGFGLSLSEAVAQVDSLGRALVRDGVTCDLSIPSLDDFCWHVGCDAEQTEVSHVRATALDMLKALPISFERRAHDVDPASPPESGHMIMFSADRLR